MTGLTRRGAIVGAGGTALSALAVVGWTGRDGGSPRASHEPEVPPVRWLALGAVSVLGATRWSASADDIDDGHGHGGTHAHDEHEHATADASGKHQVHAASPTGHDVWTDTLLVDLALRNSTDRRVRISAGQFRLRVDSGLTVSHYDAEQRMVAVPAGGTVQTRISYLVPPDATTVSLDYLPAGAVEPFGLPLYPTRPQVA